MLKKQLFLILLVLLTWIFSLTMCFSQAYADELISVSQEQHQAGIAVQNNAWQYELEGILKRYVQALQASSVDEISVLISSYLKKGIDARIYAKTSIDKLKQFMAIQKSDMNRAFQELNIGEGDISSLSITRIDKKVKGLIVNAWFSIADHNFPKPFTFVRQGKDYKITVPMTALRGWGWDRYRVRNDCLEGVYFTCYGIGDYMYLGVNQETKPRCKNTCGWFSGSTFQTLGGRARKCDYNWWGIDVLIECKYGFPQVRCNDDC